MRMLTEEEMAVRVARKQELLRQQSARQTGGSNGFDLGSRTDINPDAGVNLRARSLSDNLKTSLAKQEELKKLAEATDDDYLASSWADPKAMKKSLQGTGTIKAPGLRL